MVHLDELWSFWEDGIHVLFHWWVHKVEGAWSRDHTRVSILPQSTIVVLVTTAASAWEHQWVTDWVWQLFGFLADPAFIIVSSTTVTKSTSNCWWWKIQKASYPKDQANSPHNLGHSWNSNQNWCMEATENLVLTEKWLNAVTFKCHSFPLFKWCVSLVTIWWQAETFPGNERKNKKTSKSEASSQLSAEMLSAGILLNSKKCNHSFKAQCMRQNHC